MNKTLLCVLLCNLSVAACAQTGRMIQYSTGTGFFINREGYILTNYHVIEKCQQYSVYAKTAALQAEHIASDKKHDLALLKTTLSNQKFAYFSAPTTPLYDWDSLMVIGYPGTSWEHRKPVVEAAQFIASKGPRGEDWLIQFSDSVAKGNSGGPLLDEAGNVIGVIQAKSTTSRMNKNTHEMQEIQRADIAINLPTVLKFLDDAQATYSLATSSIPLNTTRIEKRAEEFIVNIRCRIE